MTKRILYITLVLGLLFVIAGATVAQMDQTQTDQNQPMDQSQMNQSQSGQSPVGVTGAPCPAVPAGDRATVQMGPIVKAGLPASADVFVNGHLAMRIAAPAGGMSPMQRAQIIADRLNRSFANGASWDQMSVGQVGNNWTVNLGGQVIATADTRSAQAYGVQPGMLANRWATQTVVALGGSPGNIASALQPVPSMVAGSRQEIGACPPGQIVRWTTEATKSVPLISSDTGAQLGTVTVAGPQTQLNLVNSVVAYQTTSDGATIWTFVPIAGTSNTVPITRVQGVGLVSVPSSLASMNAMTTGGAAVSMITENGARWNSMINSNLNQNSLRAQGTTKVVPLYSTDMSQVVGAAQVVGSASDVARTQAVVVNTSGDMFTFHATTSSCAAPMAGEPSTQNNVVISSIIMMPAGTAAPGTSGAGPGMAAPETTTPAAPGTACPTPGTTAPEATAPGTAAPETTTPGTTQPGTSGMGTGTETVPPSPPATGSGTTTP